MKAINRLFFALISFTSLNIYAQQNVLAQLQNTSMTKAQLLTAMKTAVANFEMLEAFQNQMMTMMSLEQREALKSQKQSEQQSAAVCMGIDLDHLVATENRIKADKQRMMNSIDQCSVHLPESIAMDGSNQQEIQPFSSCIYALGAEELGISAEKAQQCGYGENLVNRYKF